MKKSHFISLFLCIMLASCGGSRTVKPASKPAPPVAVKPSPVPAKTPPSNTPTPAATTPSKPSQPDDQIGDNSKKPGGYYLDDGPDANPPQNLDTIPDAVPKNEPLLPRSNKPYKALGKTYTPLTTAQNYKERGNASWYGKRFHGKKTSSGEIYDMYGMSAAHTILPLPSYVKVTNIANGRSVIVRVNDRGPFKSTRIIDLSYAAAHKLRLLAKGSGLVEVEAIDQSQTSSYTPAKVASATGNTATSPTQPSSPPAQAISSPPDPVVNEPAQVAINSTNEPTEVAMAQPANLPQPTEIISQNNTVITAVTQFFIQAGAFKNETNAATFVRKIQGLDIEQNAGINSVYNNGLHRIKLGPYNTRQDADLIAAKIRKQLNVATIILTQ
jgi:rare lipoprotein A